MNRKEFLQHLLSISVTILGGQVLIQGCGQKSDDQTKMKEQGKPNPCEDLSSLTADDLEVRNTFEYVDKTPYPEKRCDNCSLWVAPEGAEKCGGCSIMNGPIKAEAYCNAWVAMES